MGKALKSVFKVATLGVGGTALKALSGGVLNDKTLGSLTGGIIGADPAAEAAKDAARQQAAVAQQQSIISANASALQANSALDNTATVVAGGSADAVGDSDLKRRKGTSLASTLGV